MFFKNWSEKCIVFPSFHDIRTRQTLLKKKEKIDLRLDWDWGCQSDTLNYNSCEDHQIPWDA